MCRNCINYLDLHPKLKPQAEMGMRYYRCLGRDDTPPPDSSLALDTPVQQQNIFRHCISDNNSSEGRGGKKLKRTQRNDESIERPMAKRKLIELSDTPDERNCTTSTFPDSAFDTSDSSGTKTLHMMNP